MLMFSCFSTNLGYREKVFAIIGIKVYAAGLYVNDSVFSRLDAWRGRSAAEIQQDPSLFNNIFEGKWVMFNSCDWWDAAEMRCHLGGAEIDFMNCSQSGEIATYCAGQRY